MRWSQGIGGSWKRSDWFRCVSARSHGFRESTKYVCLLALTDVTTIDISSTVVIIIIIVIIHPLSWDLLARYSIGA